MSVTNRLGVSSFILLDLRDLLSFPQHLLHLLFHELLSQSVFWFGEHFLAEIVTRGRLIMFVTAKTVLQIGRVDPETDTLLHSSLIDILSRSRVFGGDGSRLDLVEPRMLFDLRRSVPLLWICVQNA